MESLVAAARDGDAEAFSKLVEDHYRAVYGLAYSAVGDWGAAEEITQEVFLTAWANLARLKAREAFTVWLCRITRNLTLDWRRSAAYRHRLVEHHRHVAAKNRVASPTIERVQREEQRGEIWDAIAPLPPKLRAAIVLYYLEEQSIAEVADTLGISPRAVKKRLERARYKLRAYFEVRWQVELDNERRRVNPRQAARLLLPALHLGPADKVVSSAAAGSGLGSGAFHISGQSVRGVLQGVMSMSAKKGLLVGIGLLFSAYLAYLALQSRGPAPSAPPVAAPIESSEEDAAPLRPDANPFEAEKRAEVVDASHSDGEADTTEVEPEENPAGETSSTEPTQPLWEHKKIQNSRDYVTVYGWVHDPELRPVPYAVVTVLATGLARAGVAREELDPEELALIRQTFERTEDDPQFQFIAECDEEGRFRVEGICYEGPAKVIAAAEGYYTGTSLTFSIVPGATPSKVDLEMKRGVVLDGEVLNAKGTPVKDAKLKVLAYTLANGGGGGGGRSDEFRTDEQGQFTLTANGEGTVSVRVKSATQGNAHFAMVPVYPGAYAVLQYPEGASVHGRVTWSDGKPATQCRLILRGQSVVTSYDEHGNVASRSSTTDSEAQRHGVVDPEGAFMIGGVTPGPTYSMDIEDADGTLLVRGLAVGEVSPGEDLEWNCVIEEAIIVRGRVLGRTTGKPLEHILVHSVSMGIDVPGISTRETASSDEEGAYELRILSGSGQYRIGARYNRGGYYYSPGPDSELNWPFELKSGDTIDQDLLIPEPWTRTFRLVDTKGTPLSRVKAKMSEYWHHYGAHSGPRELVSDGDGRIVIDGLPPGTENHTSFSLGGYASTQSTIRGAEEGQVLPEETIAMYRATGLTGLLTKDTGEPIQNQRVSLNVFYGDGQEKHLKVMTDSYGVFEIEDEIPATSLIIEIVAEDDQKRKWIHLTEPLDCPPGLVMDLGRLDLVEVK